MTSSRMSVNGAGECSGTLTVGGTNVELLRNSQHLYVRAEKWSFGAASTDKADGRRLRWDRRDTDDYEAFLCEPDHRIGRYADFTAHSAVRKGTPMESLGRTTRSALWTAWCGVWHERTRGHPRPEQAGPQVAADARGVGRGAGGGM
ncbi:hypothetical protein GCM10027168_70560 [Streptomyces capparidis]